MMVQTLSNSVKFRCTSDIYAPWKREGSAFWVLKAKPTMVPEVGMGNVQPHNNVNMGVAPSTARIPSKGTLHISSGVRILEVPEGWKLVWTTCSELASKGGQVVNSGHITSGEIVFYVCNVGKNIISIVPGDPVALCWIEPIYHFEWERQ